MESIVTFCAWLLSLIVSFVLGSYVRAYSAKKGENRAIHEDLGRLVKQVEATTEAAKRIEEQISHEFWDQQRQWELRRDVLLKTSQRLAAADDALLSLETVSCYPTRDTDPNCIDAYVRRQKAWSTAASSLDESRFAVGVVCKNATIDAIDSFAALANDIASNLSKKDLGAYREKALELAKRLYAARHAIRKELGVESLLTPQSSESAAAHTTDATGPEVTS
ncbi:MAG: hypothetical protein WBM14_00380 [Terracidiphilus sp.]|jgi:hypothetical protein